MDSFIFLKYKNTVCYSHRFPHLKPHEYTYTPEHTSTMTIKKSTIFFSTIIPFIFYHLLCCFVFFFAFWFTFLPPLIQLLIRVIAINSATKRIFFCSFFLNCSMSCIIGLWNSSFISNWWYMSVVEMEIFDNTVNTYAVLFEWITTTTTSTKQIIINIQRNFSYDVDVDAIHNGM